MEVSALFLMYIFLACSEALVLIIQRITFWKNRDEYFKAMISY